MDTSKLLARFPSDVVERIEAQPRPVKIYNEGDKDTSLKSVLVIYMGGTIGMIKSKDHGYRPEPGFLTQYLRGMPEMASAMTPNMHLVAVNPLMDSSDVCAKDWQLLAGLITMHYAAFDAFMVLHGTDTMAYTASALSFMLRNLSKPVFITGSQIPFVEVRNDARNNVVSCMVLLQNFHIPEVCVYFNNKLLRGNRTRKMNAWALDAFHSPNFAPLATVGVNVQVPMGIDNLHGAPDQALRVYPTMAAEAACVVRIFPGIRGDIIESLWKHSGFRAIVLECYGSGNAPSSRSLISALREAHENDIIVVAISQCPTALVNMEQYAAGSQLRRVGVVSGYDMTPEACLTKLMHLFGRGFTPAQVRTHLARNLEGELTTDEPRVPASPVMQAAATPTISTPPTDPLAHPEGVAVLGFTFLDGEVEEVAQRTRAVAFHEPYVDMQRGLVRSDSTGRFMSPTPSMGLMATPSPARSDVVSLDALARTSSRNSESGGSSGSE